MTSLIYAFGASWLLLLCCHRPVWLAPVPGASSTSASTCGSLPIVRGADIVWQNWTSTLPSVPGNAIQYKCRDGNQPTTGFDTIYCQTSGVWTTLPTCGPDYLIYCPPVPNLRNGRILVSSHDAKKQAAVGDTASFICDNSFILVGTSNSVRCLDNGTWSSMPTCVTLSPSCGEPPLVPYASEVTRTFTTRTGQAGNRVRYECYNGFNAVGRSTITCLPDGTWSDPPRCVPDLGAVSAQTLGNSCGPALPLSNGYIQGQSYSSNRPSSGGDTLSYACNATYAINGSSAVICDARTLTWTPLPVCIPNGCGPAPNLENAFIVFQNFTNSSSTPGSVIRYSCNTGFKLRPGANEIVVCTNTRVWTTLPICDNTCPQAPVVTNGSPISRFGVDGLPVQSGDSIIYACTPGYTLVGSSRIVCKTDGTWSIPPICTVIACLDQQSPVIENGVVVSTQFATGNGTVSVGDQVKYACNPGYNMRGQSIATCSNVTRRFSPIPTCIFFLTTCGNPPDVDDAKISALSYSLRASETGDTATYNCNQGFVMTGPMTITCNGNPSQWSERPICTPDPGLTCGPFNQQIDNGYVIEIAINGTSLDNAREFDTVTFACNDGYTPIGSPRILCYGSPLKWSDPPICRRNDQSSSTSSSTTTTTTTTTKTSTKTSTSTTTSTSLVGCPSAPKIRNADEVSRSFSGRLPTEGDTVTYTCWPGFTLIGRSMVICTDNSWRVQLTCQANTT